MAEMTHREMLEKVLKYINCALETRDNTFENEQAFAALDVATTFSWEIEHHLAAHPEPAAPEPHIYEEHELWDDYIDVRFIKVAETVAEEATESAASKELTKLCDHYRKYQAKQKRYEALVSILRDKRSAEQLSELKALAAELTEQHPNPPSPSENPVLQELKVLRTELGLDSKPIAAPEKVGEVWVARMRRTYGMASSKFPEYNGVLSEPTYGEETGRGNYFCEALYFHVFEHLHRDFILQPNEQCLVDIMEQVQPDGSTRTWWQRAGEVKG